MQNEKKYWNLSRRQVFRRLAAQWKEDVDLLSDLSFGHTNDLQYSNDISYIRQEQLEGNSSQTKVDDEPEITYNFVENVVDIENAQLNYEDQIIQGITSKSRCYKTDPEEESENDPKFIENENF